MPLNIKSPEADRVVRELAELTGESITDAVIRSVRDRLEREHAKRGYERRRREILRIRERYQQLPIRDDRPADEILGYDQEGLPGG